MANKFASFFLFKTTIGMSLVLFLSFFFSHTVVMTVSIIYILLNFLVSFVFISKAKQMNPLFVTVKGGKESFWHDLTYPLALNFFIFFAIDYKQFSVLFFLYCLMFMKKYGITPVFYLLGYNTFQEVKLEESKRTFILFSQHNSIKGKPINVVEISDGILLEK